MKSTTTIDVLIIGAGAAGMMCAIEAGRRGRTVMVIDHAKRIGEKIRISGGGRCNFTNLHTSPANYLSDNPRFCISALKRYGPQDIIKLINDHKIAYHEKTLGQLFCDGSAQQIVDMLRTEAENSGVTIRADTQVDALEKTNIFEVETSSGLICAHSLVIATGGKSIPKMGATGFGYDIARQFGHSLIEPRAGLVPLTFDADMMEQFKDLAGVALDVEVTCNKTRFREALLFTHRGLSGPAILQISSYWMPGKNKNSEITINLVPDVDMLEVLKTAKQDHPRSEAQTILSHHIPKRLAQKLTQLAACTDPLAQTSDAKLRDLAGRINCWRLRPNGTEGYRTAEVTLGGLDTREISSKTFESTLHPGLYFIGETLDVTGHLGGFNFQWAWASGHAAGQFV